MQKRDMYSIEQNTTWHVCFSQIAPCIHSSHNDLFLFWNQFFRICQECISTDSIWEYIYRKKKLDMKYKVLKSSSGIVNLSTKRDFPGEGRNARRLCRTPGNRSPFEPGSLIETFVLSHNRTTWICDLCSCLCIEK